MKAVCLFLLLLEASYSSADVTIQQEGSPIASKTFTLTCTATSSNIMWSKGGTILSTNSTSGITVGAVNASGGSYTRTLMFSLLRVAQGGVYKCQAGSQSQTTTVNVQLQCPVSKNFVPSLSSESYVGVMRSWSCQFQYGVKFDDPDVTFYLEVKKDNATIIQTDRLSYTPTATLVTDVALAGDLIFDYLTLADTGKYECIITAAVAESITYSSNMTCFVPDVAITVLKPIPSVTLTPEHLYVPNDPKYNTILATCSDILPFVFPFTMLVFEKQYSWTVNGTAVSDGITGPQNPRNRMSSGTLNVDVSQVGVVTLTCTVNISVPDDPVILRMGSTIVNVIGPADPSPAINVYFTNITYKSVIVNWSIPTITYTPENYTVQYGTSKTSLTSYDTVIVGTMNYSEVNVDYSTYLTGLNFNTRYFIRVRSENTVGVTVSDFANFTTLSTDAPSGAPQNFSALPVSSDKIFLRWRSVKESLRNFPIISYTLSCNSTQPAVIIEAEMSLEDSSIISVEAWYSHNMTGLTPYTVYSCMIHANSSGGAGPIAIATAETLEGVPGTTPTNIKVVGVSSSSVNISWLPPDVPNGVVIKYTVYIDLLNGTTFFYEVHNGYVQSYILKKLSPYQAVQVRVSASTRVGEGPRSMSISGQSLQDFPEALTNINFVPISSSQLKVNFTSPPLSVTNGIVLWYNITIAVYKGQVLDSRNVSGNASSIETIFTGLRGETPYVVTLFAVNSAGSGEVTSEILFTEEGTPPPPTILNSVRLNGTHMNVSWVPIPLTEAKGFITMYVINYSPKVTVAGRRRQTGSITVSGNQSYAIVSGLSSSAQYSVTVYASNMIGGQGESSQEVVVERSNVKGESSSSSIFTTTNIVIGSCAIVVVLVIVVAAILITVAFCRRRKSESTDFYTDKTTTKPVNTNENVIEMGVSMAYGQLPHTPEPDSEQFEKAFSDISDPNPTYHYAYCSEADREKYRQKVANARNISTPNPTYNSSEYSKPYEHMYESIDNIMLSKRNGFESYDMPKPQVSDPRPHLPDPRPHFPNPRPSVNTNPTYSNEE